MQEIEDLKSRDGEVIRPFETENMINETIDNGINLEKEKILNFKWSE